MKAETFLTGATDGIGLALARRWQARGLSPLLSGRRPLDALDPARYPAGLFEDERYVCADLAEPGAAQSLVEQLDARGVEGLERLVLNAACGWVGAPADTPPEALEEMLAVNLWAPLELCHRLLPRLRAVRGRIVFVSSVVASLPVADFAVYGATKAALEGLARSLRAELAGEVEVQVLRPGGTRTGLHDKSGASAHGLDASRLATADEVAGAIDRALLGGPRWQTLGAANRMAHAAGKHFGSVIVPVAARRRGARDAGRNDAARRGIERSRAFVRGGDER